MADPPPDLPEPQRIKYPPLPPFHVYAIARLAGRYRCLGGVCCPSPYEATSKESIVLFLRRTFSDASNRIPLVLELELGSDFYACRRRAGLPPAHSPLSEEEEEKPCFPFIHTCLCVGSVSLMEDARYQGWNHFGESVFPLSADEILGNCPVGCWCRSELLPEDAATTGMSVIFVDVTEPKDIRHQFATWEPDLDPVLESTKLQHLVTGWSLPRWCSDGMNNGLFTEEEKRELAFAIRTELGA